MRPVMTMKRLYSGPHNNIPAGYEDVVAGSFHGWGVEYEEFEQGPGNATVAIVEFSDGTVELLHPSVIRFLDSEEAHERDVAESLSVEPIIAGL